MLGNYRKEREEKKEKYFSHNYKVRFNDRLCQGGKSDKIRSIKILIICRYFQLHIGGVEKHVKSMVEILLKKGYRVAIVTEKYEKGLSDEELIEWVEVY